MAASLAVERIDGAAGHGWRGLSPQMCLADNVDALAGLGALAA